MEKEKFSMLGMEDQLQQDDTGSYKKALLEQLDELNTQLKAAMDKGLAPTDFEAVQAVKLGTDACARVVENIWEGQHK